MDRSGRIILWSILIAAAMVAFGVTSLALRLVMGEPRHTWDALGALRELSQSWQGEGEEAWPHYEALFEFLDEQGLSGRSFPSDELITVLIGQWDDPEAAPGRAAIESLRPAQALLDRAARSPRFNPPWMFDGVTDAHASGPEPLFNVLLPHLGQMQSLTRWNTARLRGAAATGDWEDLIRSVRTGLGLARHVGLSPFVISSQISQVMLSQLVHECMLMLSEHDLPAEVCDELLAALDEAPWPPRPIGEMLEPERIAQHDWLQWLFSDDGNGDGVLLSSQVWAFDFGFRRVDDPMTVEDHLTNLAITRNTLVSRRTTRRIIDEYFDRLAQVAGLTDIDAIQNAGALPLPPSTTFMWRTLPAFERGLRNERQGICELAAFRVGLRLARHRARTGAWPATLLDAMTEEEARCPFTADPFIYALAPNEAGEIEYALSIPPEALPWLSLQHNAQRKERPPPVEEDEELDDRPRIEVP